MLIPTEKEYSVTVRRLATHMEGLLAKNNIPAICHIKFERYYDCPEISLIRHLLAQPVFERFVEQFKASIKCMVA
jgi:hypothetical protein